MSSQNTKLGIMIESADDFISFSIIFSLKNSPVFLKYGIISFFMKAYKYFFQNHLYTFISNQY